MGKTIFIGAGKGGVGKTMTAASLGGGLLMEFCLTEVCIAFSRETSENASIHAKFCHAKMLRFKQTSSTQNSMSKRDASHRHRQPALARRQLGRKESDKLPFTHSPRP
jgi:hypothetical protein